jgi:hypothetical protein
MYVVIARMSATRLDERIPPIAVYKLAALP